MNKHFRISIQVIDRVNNMKVHTIEVVTVLAEDQESAIALAYERSEDVVREGYKILDNVDVVLGEVVKVEQVFDDVQVAA